jgi:hypothetical protein
MKKDEVSEALETERELMLDLIDELDDEVIETGEVMPGWTTKDLLVHLTLWEAELVKLLWQAKQGARPTTIHMQQYSVDEVNQRWHSAMRDRPLDLVLNDYHSVRKQTLRRLESFSDRDLTDPQRYPWLKGEPLWQWIASDSFEHEAEHRQVIEDWIEAQGLNRDT